MNFKQKAIRFLSSFLRTKVCASLIRFFFRKPAFIITQSGSQLGNQLTIFAHAIAISREIGREVWDPSFFGYARYFENTDADLWTRFPERKSWFSKSNRLRYFIYAFFAKLVRLLIFYPNPPVEDLGIVTDFEKNQVLHEKGFLNQTLGKRVVLLEGYFFRTSAEILQKHADCIRDFFKPLQQHEQNASLLIQNLRTKASVLVAVHLRQFDPVKDGVHPLYQYDHVHQMTFAMKQIESFFPDKRVMFVIFSNKPVESNCFDGFLTAQGTGQIAEDLHAMGLCDYILASTYSTYSRWASFYGKAPLYQMQHPDHLFSLNDFKEQMPGFYDLSDKNCSILV